MNYRIVYSPVAADDLDHVWDDVLEASQDFDVANQYIADFRNAIRQKKKYPKTGTALSYMGEFTGLYYVSFKAYKAFYRISGDAIEVARILYSKSDYMKTLFGKSEYRLEDDDDEGGN